jgi:hypothetical protein
MRGSRRHRRVWKLLLDALMWSGLIEVHYICVEETVELLLMQDQEVIKAFSPDAAQKALTDGICSWSLIRRSKHFDATGCCHTCKTRPEFAIVIPNQIPGSLFRLTCTPSFSMGDRCSLSLFSARMTQVEITGYYTPVWACTRPSLMAASRAAWSRSVWSA